MLDRIPYRVAVRLVAVGVGLLVTSAAILILIGLA